MDQKKPSVGYKMNNDPDLKVKEQHHFVYKTIFTLVS